jgi:hypothetical protein
MFWQSAIPHNARIPWWRLLHDKIPHRIRLHHRQPDKVVSAECGICQNVLEDDFHLFVGCRLKWCVWQKALQELSLFNIADERQSMDEPTSRPKKQAEG